GRHPRPGEADEDRAAAMDVLAVKDAEVALEAADDRWVELPGAARGGPVDRPPALLRVEEAERHADEPAVVLRPEHVLVPQAVEDRPDDRPRAAHLPVLR